MAKRRKMTTHQDQENPLMDDNILRVLPQELWTKILTNVVLVQMYSEDTAKRQERDETIFSVLASVTFLWFRSLKTRYLKNSILRFSTVYFQGAKMRSTIIRNNHNFLKEVMDPDKIIFPLESCGCLTEDQVTFLTRLRNYKDKNHELLFMLQEVSSQKYSQLHDCLLATNQIPASLVLERGEVVKVHISNGKERRTREFEIELIKRIQRMPTENILILNDLLNASDEKGLNVVHVLHAKQNKGIELWFWCKTENSLSRLKSLSNDDLLEVIQRMYQRLIPEQCTSLEPRFIQRDSTLTSDFAERRISFRRVTIPNNISLSDVSLCVTSLEDKIYVTQGKEILVIPNKYPFQSLKSIEFSGPCDLYSIASCSINKCLYISTYENRCIYKIEPEFDNRISKYQDDPGVCPVSVTSRGDVLILVIGSEGNELRIITHEGTVKRTISMDGRFNRARFIQEIMPDIVALNYRELAAGCIEIIRLDENETILRLTEWNHEIVCLSSFRYGDLLIGVSGYKDAAMRNSTIQIYNSDLVDLECENDEKETEMLQHWTLESKVTRNLFETDEKIYSIHFAAHQKQLYVCHSNRLDIYQLNYEDEDYET